MKTKNLYCGVDLHYNNSTICILRENGEMKEHIEINTKREEIEKIIKKYQEHNIHYAFEAGNMTRYLYKIVNDFSNTKRTHIVHPLKFKIITESKHKNDKNDSKNLALALLKDYLPCPVHIKSEECRQLQILLNLRRRMVSTRTKLIQQAKSIIRSLGIKAAIKSLKSIRGFQEIINLIENEKFDKETIEFLFEEFKIEDEKIRMIEEKIFNLISKNFHGEYKLLMTIPGIAFVTAATIIAYVDNIKRFQKAGQLSAYFGLVPSEYSSGEKTKHGRITKEGIKEIRALLIQAAWTFIRMRSRNDDRLKSLRNKYHKLAFKGKNSQKAIVAIARHLSRIIFGVLNNETPYSGIILKKQESVKPAIYNAARELTSRLTLMSKS